MKKLIERDLILFKNIPLIYKIVFFFVTFSYLISYNINYYDDNLILILTGSSLKYDLFVNIGFMFIINGLYFSCIYYIYKYDFVKNCEFTFLRISKIKWLLSKYISIFIISLIYFSIISIIAFLYILIVAKELSIYMFLHEFALIFICRTTFVIIMITCINIFKRYHLLVIFAFLFIPLMQKYMIFMLFYFLYPENLLDFSLISVTFILILFEMFLFIINKNIFISRGFAYKKIKLKGDRK